MAIARINKVNLRKEFFRLTVLDVRTALDFVGGGILGEGVGALKAAVPDAELLEEGADGGGVLQDLTGVAERERCHAEILLREGSK
jgi:hypothetical protein